MRKKLFLLTVLLLVLGTLALTLRTPVAKHILEKKVVISLKEAGFPSAQIGDVTLDGNNIFFSEISLDPDGFSKIGMIHIQYSWQNLLGNVPLPQITLKNVELTGEIASSAIPLSIAGWNNPGLGTLYDFFPAKDVVVNSLKADFMTAIGGLRFNMNGKIRKDETKGLTHQLTITSVQHQLRLNSKWEGEWHPDGQWSSTGELYNTHLKAAGFAVSRVEGWISFGQDAAGNRMNLSGQFTGGSMNLSELSLHRLSLTFDKAENHSQLILKGNSARYPDALLSADYFASLNNGKKNSNFELAYDANSLKSFTGFLNELRQGMDELVKLSSNAQNITLAPVSLPKDLRAYMGNERSDKDLQKLLQKLDYDRLELSILGPPEDMIGKILVKQENGTDKKQQVIRLTPTNDSQ